MKRASIPLVALALLVAAASPAAAAKSKFKATLHGYNEVPPVSSAASGDLQLDINKDDTAIDFTLTYDGMSGPVAAAHIHFGQPGVNGGVSVFFCGGGKPACPASGTVTGTIIAADVGGPAAQGISAGELAELIKAIRAGVAYANAHTSVFPGGEIRGQIE